MQGSFVRVFVATVLHSTAYGVTFLLPLRIAEIGGDETYVGKVLGIAMVSALVSGIFSGHLTDLFGRIWSIVMAAIAQAIALTLIAVLSEPNLLGICIGMGLGFGWSVFYLLTPVFTVRISPANERVKFLTIVSGLMMLGIGLGPVVGRLLISIGIEIADIFILGACLSCLGAILFSFLQSTERASGKMLNNSAALSFQQLRSVFSSGAAIPIVMITIGGAIFGCLTSYQTTIANEKGVDFSLFFSVFVITVVAARLGLAGKINDLPPLPTTVALQLTMCIALASYVLVPQTNYIFVITTAVFGVGYGLTYSILNGMVANIEDSSHIQSALLIFPLAYFLGLYGFPFIGGWLIVSSGINSLLIVLLLLGLLELSCAVYGLVRMPKKRVVSH